MNNLKKSFTFIKLTFINLCSWFLLKNLKCFVRIFNFLAKPLVKDKIKSNELALKKLFDKENDSYQNDVNIPNPVLTKMRSKILERTQALKQFGEVGLIRNCSKEQRISNIVREINEIAASKQESEISVEVDLSQIKQPSSPFTGMMHEQIAKDIDKDVLGSEFVGEEKIVQSLANSILKSEDERILEELKKVSKKLTTSKKKVSAAKKKTNKKVSKKSKK